MGNRIHKKTEIRGGRVIDPANNIDRITSLFFADGLIVAVGEAPDGFEAEEIIDATGQIVCPGLVDLQARMREPGHEYIATIASETQAATKGGITCLLSPPDTDPIIDNVASAELIINRAKKADLARFLPTGALTKKLKGEYISEMASLREAGCVAMSNADQPVMNTLTMKRALQYAATHKIPVIIRPVDTYLSEGGCAHEGEVADRLGLNGIPDAAETIALARDLMLVEETGVQAHFSQLSCAHSVAMIADAQKRGLNVTADVTAHHLHLNEFDTADFNSNMHVLPPLRTQRDQEALITGLKMGTISAVVSDHRPWEEDDKLVPFPEAKPGISGVETLLPMVLKLVDGALFTMNDAIACLTAKPASIFNLPNGTLSVGKKADICIFNPDEYWDITPDNLISLGKNSPFLGWNVKGCVTMTLKSGQKVYQAQ